MRIGTASLLAMALSVLALAACADLETVNPAETTTTDTTTTDTTTTTDGTTTTTGEPPVPERTMLVRSPMGEPAENLLVDGDFELSTAYFGGGQYGFRMFSANGASELRMEVETGGLCRSGLTCLKLKKGQILFGRGTAAADGKGHVLSMYAKVPPETPCNKVVPLAVECDTFDVLAKANPDEDFAMDWCHYQAAFPPSKSAVCMYIQNSLPTDQVALVDAAVLAPEEGGVPMKATPKAAVDASTLAEMAQVRDHIRRTMPFGKRPGGRVLPAR